MSVQTHHRTLQLGSTGDDVKGVQKSLNVHGFGPLAEDGIFGPKTESAVKKYQSNHGLTPDGIIGPKTWHQLDLDAQ
ncbi:peptidoglycan-binding protein [Nostoc ellipsosporum NOK]|nr:peptidoglycan-binding protein [Nostoc ellipsosporum NOK]BAZ47432.1 peptidoglycan-binding domain 1 protein [Nostoc sp. NIES-4103]